MDFKTGQNDMESDEKCRPRFYESWDGVCNVCCSGEMDFFVKRQTCKKECPAKECIACNLRCRARPSLSLLPTAGASSSETQERQKRERRKVPVSAKGKGGEGHLGGVLYAALRGTNCPPIYRSGGGGRLQRHPNHRPYHGISPLVHGPV